jgi:uncharacterized protein
MTLDLLPGAFAICRLDPGAPLPAWVTGAFTSISRSRNELSIVCDSQAVPVSVTAQRNYRAFGVRGPLDFSLVGIIADVSRVLAAASISIFVVSTYDTDYVMVREADLDRAAAALRGAGHTVATGA